MITATVIATGNTANKPATNVRIGARKILFMRHNSFKSKANSSSEATSPGRSAPSATSLPCISRRSGGAGLARSNQIAMDSSCRFCLWSRPERSNDFAVLLSILPEGCLTNLPDSALYGLRRFNQSIQVRENCVISKLYIHKLLEIWLLQNALYGRLSLDGTPGA